MSAKFSAKFSAKWIKSRRAFGWAQRAQLMELKGYSPPQELEKAREAGYFSSILIKVRCPQNSSRPAVPLDGPEGPN